MNQTQHKVILKYLQLQNGWIPSYRLSKVELCGVWIGSRGERSARDLVSPECPKGLENRVKRELGKDLLAKGIRVDALGKPVEKNYAYYCAVRPKSWTVWRTSEGIVIKREPVYA